MPPLAFTPEIQALLAAGAPVALGISGGKDSDALAIAVIKHLDAIGHPKTQRVLIHADLGLIEWPETPDVVTRLANHLSTELVVVRRQAGDMIQRWETRWESNKRRYANLECVTLITPWSTPALRFCTSELKVDPICAALRRRFPGQTIISASGIRAEESPNRAKAPIAKIQPKLKSRTTSGWDWHPILHWTLKDVLELHQTEGFELHPAYTQFGSSRLSCSFCMMARIDDHAAALKHPGNHPAYLRLVALETASSFSFQNKRWLAERSPELLTPEIQEKTVWAKAFADRRRAAEAKIPAHLLYTKGWPTCLPTRDEAQLLAEIRQEICMELKLPSPYLTAPSILSRYEELYATAQKKAA